MLHISYISPRGAGITRALPHDVVVVKRVLQRLRCDATLRDAHGHTIGGVEYMGHEPRRWGWWFDPEAVRTLD